MVPMKPAMAVAVKTAALSMPVVLMILGLTARIYAIVIKVVIPAMISVLAVVPLSLRWKILSRRPALFSMNELLSKHNKGKRLRLNTLYYMIFYIAGNDRNIKFL